jgi:hypothetical protein
VDFEADHDLPRAGGALQCVGHWGAFLTGPYIGGLILAGLGRNWKASDDIIIG